MRELMIAQGIASTDELDRFEREDIRIVREAQRRAWDAYRAPIDADVKQAIEFLERLGADDAKAELQKIQAPFRRDAMRALAGALIATPGHDDIAEWYREQDRISIEPHDDQHRS